MAELAQIPSLIIGGAIAFIAWQQWRVARNKLRLDLFDRRYKVFDATRNFLTAIARSVSFQDAELFEFSAGTSDAEFLFDADVVNYIARIRNRAIDLRTQRKKYEGMPMGDERSRHVKAECGQLLWLTQQITLMTKTFTPYLGFSHVK
jgi:hypothetical protein